MATAPEQYLAIVFTGEALSAALWQQVSEKPAILARSRCFSLTSLKMHDVNRSVDAALDELGEAGASVKFVLFGVPNSWVESTGLQTEKKQILKTLTQDLLLEPLGYVANHDALAAAEREKTGRNFSGLFILPSEHFLDVDRYISGELKQSEHIGRSGDTAQDAKELLARLQAETHPDERWILLPASPEQEIEELETAITQALGRPLETLQCDQVVQTVITSGGAETLAARGSQPVNAEPASTPAPPSPSSPPESADFHPPAFLAEEELVPLNDEATVSDDHPGFTVHGAHQPENFSGSSPGNGEADANIEEVSGKKVRSRGIKFPLPSISSLSGALLKLRGKTKVLLAGGALLLVGGGSAAAYTLALRSYTVQAEVWLKTETLSETREFLITQSGDAQSATMSGLQAETLTESVELDKEVPTTGTKVIGDPAHGTVTLYNRTTQEKSFAKGTTLTVGKYTFTLDEDVTVASASSGSNYAILPGSKDTKVTAKQIGPESNLEKNQEFSVGNFATSSYVAKNNEPFTGGTSREIQAVAKKDIDAAVSDLLQAATTQLKEKVEAQNTAESPVLFTQQVKITDTTTSAKVGDEQKFVTVKITVEGQGLRIPAEELKRVAQETFSEQLSGNRIIQPESTTITPSGITGNTKDLRLQATLSTQALPTVVPTELEQKILGQYGPRAITLLQEQNGIARAQLTFQPRWAESVFKKLPSDPERVELSIRVQEGP